MISLMKNTTSNKMVDQNDDFIMKESCNLYLISKSSEWITSGQNTNLTQKV